MTATGCGTVLIRVLKNLAGSVGGCPEGVPSADKSSGGRSPFVALFALSESVSFGVSKGAWTAELIAGVVPTVPVPRWGVRAMDHP